MRCQPWVLPPPPPPPGRSWTGEITCQGAALDHQQASAEAAPARVRAPLWARYPDHQRAPRPYAWATLVVIVVAAPLVVVHQQAPPGAATTTVVAAVALPPCA